MTNATITETTTESKEAVATKKKRGPYLHLTFAQRFQVGKRAAEFLINITGALMI